MKRRASVGLRGALAAAARQAAEVWAVPGRVPAVPPPGRPVIVDTRACGALFPVDAPPWVLLTADDAVVPLEPVFYPGDGSRSLYTGGRSLRNYRRADTGEMVLPVDRPRVPRPTGRAEPAAMLPTQALTWDAGPSTSPEGEAMPEPVSSPAAVWERPGRSQRG